MKYIKEITAEETYPVRHPVLRAGKPIESCRFDGDDLKSTKHFGIFIDGKLSGVVSLLEKVNPLFATNNQFQLRGMGVVEEQRRNGYGEDLVNHCEDYIRNKGGALIWFNARIIAMPFYKKLGYESIGDAFDLADVGTHYVMSKTISP